MTGNRIPLVLLPGLLCDEALWRHQLDHLGDVADMTVADFTVGESMGDFAEHVLDIASDRFSLAALSMGGYAAQEVMRRAPERVERLALFDTSARADSAEQRARRRGLIDLAQRGNFKGVTPRLMPLLIHEDRMDDAALTEPIMEMAGRIGQAAFLRQQKAILGRPDGRGDLARISCPTLIACGRQDVLTPVDVHEEMAAGLDGAKLVVIEACGHMAPMERPEAVTALLRYWLQT